jgi:predicted O-linked N-acetylglucosamine transferase (SPINDLY family)
VLSLDGSHPNAHINLGNYHLRSGDDAAALAHYTAVVNSTRATARHVRHALNNVGALRRLRNDHAAALAAFTQCLELGPDDPMALANVMVAHRSLCDWRRLEELQDRVRARLPADLAYVPRPWPTVYTPTHTHNRHTYMHAYAARPHQA